MIEKVTGQFIKDLTDLFKTFDISLESEYHPEIDGVRSYGKNLFVYREHEDFRYERKTYANKLLYNIGTPELEDKGQNTNIRVLVSDLERNGVTVMEEGALPRLTLTSNTKGQDAFIRRATYLRVPINVSIITDDSELFHNLMLFYFQEMQIFTAMTVEVAADPKSKDLCELPYYVDWRTDPMEVDYADFKDNQKAANTISFTVWISGAFVSGFLTQENLIETLEITSGVIPNCE